MARDTNFYYSFMVLPAEKRAAIIAVWDFCRAVDDAVDEAEAGTEAAQVAIWKREVAACFEGGAPVTRQGQALAPLIPKFNLPRAAFDALVEGVEMDIGSRRYETFADLYEYCIRVASAVGLMCVEIFGYSDPRTRQYATNLGVALQLTNILRDVPKDLAIGRVYLPQEDLRRFGVSEDALRREAANAGRGIQSREVKALLAYQASRAREYYVRARASRPSADGRRLVAAEIMGAIYFSILEKIESNDYDVFSGVIRIPRPRRALIAVKTWLKNGG
ncbi:MAG: squalene/phytoene synthase family protein [Acidobacteriota bacterium]|nr:squalene/phytoene synthase family protein [Acidobacteriota bacterium]MDQ3419090.1 squalene/phytoene synthase family protein [Acidobacteriota bacterium]